MAKSFVVVRNKIHQRMKILLGGNGLHFFSFLISERIIAFNINSESTYKKLDLPSTQLGLI